MLNSIKYATMISILMHPDSFLFLKYSEANHSFSYIIGSDYSLRVFGVKGSAASFSI